MKRLLPLIVLVAAMLVAGCTSGGTAASSTRVTVETSPPPTSTTSPTAAPTPPRASRASWASQTATVSDVIARFRSAGLNVEAQPPPSLVIFGAERVDQFLVQRETVAIYSLATAADSARVLDGAANNRLTVTYLRTPYYVQVANLLVVITTDDSSVAARTIEAIMRPM